MIICGCDEDANYDNRVDYTVGIMVIIIVIIMILMIQIMTMGISRRITEITTKMMIIATNVFITMTTIMTIIATEVLNRMTMIMAEILTKNHD